MGVTTAKNIKPAPIGPKLNVSLVCRGSVVSSPVIKIASAIIAQRAQRSRGYRRSVMNGGRCATIQDRSRRTDGTVAVSTSFIVARKKVLVQVPEIFGGIARRTNDI